MGTVSVVVATFGDEDVWGPQAALAAASARDQSAAPHEVIVVHDANLAAARNRGAEEATGEWLVFLDADDRLDHGYIAAIADAAPPGPALIQPATRGWHWRDDGSMHVDDDADLIPVRRRNLLDGNHLVIGTAVRAEQFHRVGGFDDLPVLEDWDLWLRCWIDGACLTAAPQAEYLIQVRPHSRNTDASAHSSLYRKIRAKYTPLAAAAHLT